MQFSSTGGTSVAERPAAVATVKIAPDLLRKAKQFVAFEDITLAEYIDRIVRPTIEKDFARMLRKQTEGEK